MRYLKFLLITSILMVSCNKEAKIIDVSQGAEEQNVKLILSLNIELVLQPSGSDPNPGYNTEENFSVFENVFSEEVNLTFTSTNSNYVNTLTFNANDLTTPPTIKIPYGSYTWSIEDSTPETPLADYLFRNYLPVFGSGSIDIFEPSVSLDISVSTDFGLVSVEENMVSAAKIVNADQHEKPLTLKDGYYYIYAKEGTDNKLMIEENIYNTTISLLINDTGEIVAGRHYNYILTLSDSEVSSITLEAEPFVQEDYYIQPNYDSSTRDINDLYEHLYKSGSGGVGGQEDYGIKTQDIQLDILSGDMPIINKAYNRLTGISELTATMEPSNNYNLVAWNFFYETINIANNLIESLGGSEYTPETDIQRYNLGQAIAARGWAYFWLSNIFIDDLSNLSSLGVPIYLNSNEEHLPRSTVQESLNQAISDLHKARQLLYDFNRASKIQFNRDIVDGILAYVYGSLNDWQEAANYALRVINSGYPIMTAEEVAYMGPEDTIGGFNDVNSHPGIIWGVDITTENELNSLQTWWGWMDYYSYSYQATGNYKAIDLDLYYKISENDVRKNQFSSSIGPLLPTGKFYYKGAQENGFRGFSGPQSNIDSDNHYMRISEFYLLYSEASFHLGNEGEAISYLKFLLDKRIEDTSYLNSLTGQNLLNEIINQTRIELFGEGKSYFLMKRERMSKTRGDNWLDFPGETFSHNDDRLTYEIPQSIIDTNPNINGQN